MNQIELKLEDFYYNKQQTINTVVNQKNYFWLKSLVMWFVWRQLIANQILGEKFLSFFSLILTERCLSFDYLGIPLSGKACLSFKQHRYLQRKFIIMYETSDTIILTNLNMHKNKDVFLGANPWSILPVGGERSRKLHIWNSETPFLKIFLFWKYSLFERKTSLNRCNSFWVKHFKSKVRQSEATTFVFPKHVFSVQLWQMFTLFAFILLSIIV